MPLPGFKIPIARCFVPCAVQAAVGSASVWLEERGVLPAQDKRSQGQGDKWGRHGLPTPGGRTGLGVIWQSSLCMGHFD